jgi:HAE1 family hydrophobic/amphiphilic exporter-1
MNQVQRMLDNNPAIDKSLRITGYNFIAGQGSNQGTFIVKLKPFDERNRSEYSTMVLGMIYKQTAVIKGAQILAFQPPMVTGFSASNGLTFSMQDRTGGDLDKFFDITKQFLAELNKRPEFSNAMTAFNSSYPQYQIDVDVSKCKQAGISPSTVLTTMQGYYGGIYSSNFNAYGKLYRVYVQGDPKTREDYSSLKDVYVRTSNGQMSPVNEFINLKRVYGPQVINRFNLFTAININATPASGYSTGDCIAAMDEVARTTLPAGFTYEFSGLTRNEAESSNSTGIILVLCLVFVYLILAAQYESYLLPLTVILSVSFGLAGAFLFTNLFGKSNDIYMQIALIMLVGLLAKNAILIVQFALERRRLGMAISWSAILGSAARLRPILMTALAMIIGLFPLIITGIPGLSLFMPPAVGENGYITLGAAAIGGMLVGTFCQILVVPALFVIFQYLQERFTPLQFEDELNSAVEAELAQYTMPKDKHISEIKGNYVK